MPTQEVPHYEWARFFDEFSWRHQSWLVMVEMSEQSDGRQVQVRDLPLVGIMVEPNEIGEDEITIIAGSRPEAHISHTVRLPRRVFLKQNDEAEDESVEIESFGGTVFVSLCTRLYPRFQTGCEPNGLSLNDEWLHDVSRYAEVIARRKRLKRSPPLR